MCYTNRLSKDNNILIVKSKEDIYNKYKSSKSEVPSHFINTQKNNSNNNINHTNINNNNYNNSNNIAQIKCHKIAKSEVFNIQVDLKKTYDEISVKKSTQTEEHRNKLGQMKKELMLKFFKSSK